ERGREVKPGDAPVEVVDLRPAVRARPDGVPLVERLAVPGRSKGGGPGEPYLDIALDHAERGEFLRRRGPGSEQQHGPNHRAHDRDSPDREQAPPPLGTQSRRT